MLCDDSLELEHGVSSEGAKLIQMKDWDDIKLSNIWIPSELLPNRQTVTKSNVVQFSIYHTLEKPLLLSDSFSTYSDQSKNVFKNNIDEEELLDSLEEVTLCADQRSYQCSTEENNKICTYLDSNKGPLDSTAYLLEDLSLHDTDYLDLLQNTEESETNMEGNKFIFNKESVENASDNTTDLKHSNVNHNKHLNSTLICKTKVTDNSALSSVPLNVVKRNISSDCASNCGKLSHVKLKNACLSQTNDYDLFSKDSLESCSYAIRSSSCSEFWNSSKSSTELSVPNEKSVCKLAQDISVPEMPNVGYELSKPSSSSVIDEVNLECSDAVAKFLTLPGKYCVGSHSSDNVISDINFKLLEENNEELNKDSTDSKNIENDINISSFQNLKIYQRPKEDSVIDSVSNNKKKTKKEKKVKQKNERSMPLEDFFLDPNEAKYMEPEIDEFYESIIRRNNMKDSDNPISKAAFPPLPEKPIIFEPLHELKDSGLNCFTSIEAEAYCLSNNAGNPEFDFENQLVGNKLVNNKSTIIIENIPLGINEEMLRSLLVMYGDIKSLNITRRKKFLVAELIVDVEDPDWIIESLDGTQPFGTAGASSEVLRCYQKF